MITLSHQDGFAVFLHAMTASEVIHNARDCSLYNKTARKCQCGSDLAGAIDCNEKEMEVSVKGCYCMTFDRRKWLVTAFIHVIHYIMAYQITGKYFKIDTNITTTNLNNMTCGRKGVV